MLNRSFALLIKKELLKIKTRYKKKYGAVFFDVKIKNSGNFIFLEGKVLSERQKKEALLAAQKILKNVEIKNDIKVLSDPSEKLEIGWAVIKNEVVDLRSFFKKRAGSSGEGPALTRASLGGRTTQALKGDIIRLLAQKAGRCLAQTSDLSMGWIKREDIVKTKNASLIRKWKKTKRLTAAGKKIEISKTESGRKRLVVFLRKYFNAPYLMGGVTEKGIDCSGLTQKFYLEIFKVFLPRHSTDQGALGKEINFAQSRFGDLVFLRHREKKYPHIGVVADTNAKIDDFLILNARRDNGGVVIQTFSEVLKSYKLISTRRIIEYFSGKTD